MKSWSITREEIQEDIEEAKKQITNFRKDFEDNKKKLINSFV
jgi:sRNA-binding carbon storage regulator CsrA